MSESLQTNPHIIVELITIGREILDGRVIDTNAVRMAETLKTRGLIVRHGQRVDDDIPRIIEAFALAAGRSHIILITGGLGPTSDDLTPAAFAKFLGVPLEEQAEALAVVEEGLARRGRPLSPAQRKQALAPVGVEILKNPTGTAPGLFLKWQSEIGPQFWALMPGVPQEMRVMLTDEVLPLIPSEPDYLSHQWATHFVAEASLQERLQNLIAKLPGEFELSFRTRFPENHVGLHGNCRTPELRARFEEVCREITTLLASDSFSEGRELQEIEAVVLGKARNSKAWLSCVESCTGGLLSKKLTSVPGASENFFAGWTTYHNEAKVGLGVSSPLLREHGAVSAPVARALAEAALRQTEKALGSSEKCFAISTTGVAGPGGGTAEKPVGLCFIALAASGTETVVEEIRASPSLTREQCQAHFAQKALNLLRQNLA